MDFLSILRSCITGMIPVTVITISGAYLTHTKIFTKESNRYLSDSCTRFFFIIFNFWTAIKVVEFSAFAHLWPVLAVPLILVALSCIFSYLIIPFLTPPSSFKYSAIAAISFSSLGGVPLLIVKGICSSYGPLNGDKYCDDAMGYISLLICTTNLFIWSVTGMFLKFDIGDANGDNREDVSVLRLFISGILSPLAVSSWLGVAVGLIPGIKWLFVYKSSPLYAIYDTLISLSYLGIIVSQLMIGSNLMLLRGSQSTLSKAYILKLIIIKSFIFPAIWLLVIFGFWKAGIFGDNRVMAYTIFIGQSSPITVVVMMVAQILNFAIAECSVMFLWQYLAAPISLTLFTYIFFLMT